MSAKPRKRRSPGEGGAYSYKTAAGERWRVKGMVRLPDGMLRELNIHGVLGQAVKDSLLLRNPADAATPPTAREAKAPEMHPWNAGQLAAFLGWVQGNSQSYALWAPAGHDRDAAGGGAGAMWTWTRAR